ncbi:PaaI family thioesterase [Roseomonas stagni]|uniref:PaaI family thioesterase n=1 Tax=Falsiroseomonas algicola TaxID=2716930 RepID=A0A6M1LWP4_9PROT|nr:PaaI family thioesterase [Falsiroseomonas algicola]NGM23904.1 PaaI family thioesterase [Falsiroseomonas algicola]
MSFDPATEGWEQTDAWGLPEFLRPMWMRPDETGFSCGFQPSPALNNGRGVIHGGILATYMDHSLGRTVREAVGRVPIATIQLDLHYLAPGDVTQFVTVKGDITRQTRSIVFIRGTLTQNGKPVLSANGIWKVLSPRS